MLSSLPLFHRINGQTILVMGAGDAAEAKRRLVERAGGIVADNFETAQKAGARLAFVAVDDEEEAIELARELRSAGMLINVPDRPGLCDFTLPSILERDRVLIAVGTGGASAGLAKHLRLRLERILPQGLGELANALFAARDKLRDRFPDPDERRRVLDEGLREGGVLDPFNETSPNWVEEWASNPNPPDRGLEIAFTITSDDPEELTLKQARWLGEADTILLDGDVPEPILARARADAIRMPYSDAAKAKTRDGLTLTLSYRLED